MPGEEPFLTEDDVVSEGRVVPIRGVAGHNRKKASLQDRLLESVRRLDGNCGDNDEVLRGMQDLLNELREEQA